jgi:RNA polymerase sigma-70 factor (ECF subfamily)
MTDPHPSSEPADDLAERFATARPRLQAIARRMLGSTTDADDAVQDTWLRLARTDPSSIDNLDGWLTTVLTRVCLNALRTRTTRDESPIDARVADPVVQLDPPQLPEGAAVLADSVESALLVVLDTLPPAERVAFVLHDVFAIPFDEIGQIMDRSPAAARQLASRGRRRVQGNERERDEPVRDADPAHRRAVVDAFFRAARLGDLDGLVHVLHPDVVLRSDAGPGRPATTQVRGASAVAGRAVMFAGPNRTTRPVWVHGDPAVVVTIGPKVVAVMRFAVLGEHIVAIDALTDTDRLGSLDLPPGSSV